MLNYKYNGRTVLERFDEMIGMNDSRAGFLFRICATGFCLFTTLDPTASYYVSPLMWVLVFAFINFYL